MELDHEKFEGMKELAEISTKISAGTAALATLKATEEEYFVQREAQLTSRLQQALANSSDLIKAIGENHGALVGYKTQLDGFLKQVLSLLQTVTDARGLVDTAADELEGRITKHEQDVSEFRQLTRNTKNQLDSEAAELAAWRDRLGKEQRLADDRKAMAERTAKRVNKN